MNKRCTNAPKITPKSYYTPITMPLSARFVLSCSFGVCSGSSCVCSRAKRNRNEQRRLSSTGASRHVPAACAPAATPGCAAPPETKCSNETEIAFTVWTRWNMRRQMSRRIGKKLSRFACHLTGFSPISVVFIFRSKLDKIIKNTMWWSNTNPPKSRKTPFFRQPSMRARTAIAVV